MKLTKKAASLLLAASLAVSVCATPVFATDPSITGSETKTTADTNVTYTVDSKYTWSIPAKIDFGKNAGTNKERKVAANTEENVAGKAATNDDDGTAPKVCVTENIIAPEKALKISIDTASSTFEAGSGKGFWVGVHGDTAIEKLYFTIHKLDKQNVSGEELGASKSEVLSVPSGTRTGEQALVLTLTTTTTDTAEKAGAYTGSIAFKSEVK